MFDGLDEFQASATVDDDLFTVHFFDDRVFDERVPNEKAVDGAFLAVLDECNASERIAAINGADELHGQVRFDDFCRLWLFRVVLVVVSGAAFGIEDVAVDDDGDGCDCD